MRTWRIQNSGNFDLAFSTTYSQNATYARTAKKLAEAQSAATKAKQDELEKDLQRKLELTRSGSVTERELGQVRAQREAGAADLRASFEQIQMREEAIAIAEAEQHMGRHVYGDHLRAKSGLVAVARNDRAAADRGE